MTTSATNDSPLRRLHPLTQFLCEITTSALARHPLTLDVAVHEHAPSPASDDQDDTRVLALRGYQLIYDLLGATGSSALTLVHTPPATASEGQAPSSSLVLPETVPVTAVLAHWVWLTLWCWVEAMCRASGGLLRFPPLAALYGGAYSRARDGQGAPASPTPTLSGNLWGYQGHRSLPCPFLAPSCFTWTHAEGAEGPVAASATSWQEMVRETHTYWRATVVPNAPPAGLPPSESRMQQLHTLVALCEHYRRLERYLDLALLRLDQRMVEEQTSTPLRRWKTQHKPQQPGSHSAAGTAAATAPSFSSSTPPYRFAAVGSQRRTHSSRTATAATLAPAYLSRFGASTSPGATTRTFSRCLLAEVMARLVAYNASALVEPALQWSVRQFMRQAHVLGAGVMDVWSDEDSAPEDALGMEVEGFTLNSAPASPQRSAAPRSAFEAAIAAAEAHAPHASAAVARDGALQRRRYTLEVNLKRLPRVLRVLEDCHVRRPLAWVRHRVSVLCARYGQQMSRLALGELADAPPMPAAASLQLWPLAATTTASGDSEVCRGPTTVDASRALREAIQGYVRLRSCLLFLVAGTTHLLDDVTRQGRRCVLGGLSHYMDGFSSGDVFVKFMARWGVPLWRQLCEASFRAAQEATTQRACASGRQARRHHRQPHRASHQDLPRVVDCSHGDKVEEAAPSDDKMATPGEHSPHPRDDLEDDRRSSAEHTLTGTVHSYGEARSQSTINVEGQRQEWVRQQLSQPAPGQQQRRQQQQAARWPQTSATASRGEPHGEWMERGASSVWWVDGGEDMVSQGGSRHDGGGWPAPSVHVETLPNGLRPRPAHALTDGAADDGAADRFELHEVATLPADGFPSLIYLLSRKEHVRRRTLGVFCDQVKQFFVLSLTAERAKRSTEDANNGAGAASGQPGEERLLPPQTFRACVLALKTTMESFEGLRDVPADAASTRHDGHAKRAALTPSGEAVRGVRGMTNAADDHFNLHTNTDRTGSASSDVGASRSSSSGGSSSSSTSSRSCLSAASHSTRRSRDSQGHRVRDVVGGQQSVDGGVGDATTVGDVDSTPWAALLHYCRQHRQGGAPTVDAQGNLLYSAADVAQIAVYKGIALFFSVCEQQASYTMAQALSLRVEQQRKHMRREAAALLAGTRQDERGRQGNGGDARTGRAMSPHHGIVHLPSAQDDGIDLLIALVSLLPTKETFVARFLQLQVPHLLQIHHLGDLDFDEALRRRLERQLGSVCINPYTVILRDVRASLQSPYTRLMDRLDGHLRRRERQRKKLQKHERSGRGRVGESGTGRSSPDCLAPLVATMLPSAVSHWTTPVNNDAGSVTSSRHTHEAYLRSGHSGGDRSPVRSVDDEENENIRRARAFLGMDTAPTSLPPPPTGTRAPGGEGARPATLTTAGVPEGRAATLPLRGRVLRLKEAPLVSNVLRRVHLLCRTWWGHYTGLSVSASRLRKQHERGAWWTAALVDAVLRVEWYVQGAGQGARQTAAAAQLLAVWDARGQRAPAVPSAPVAAGVHRSARAGSTHGVGHPTTTSHPRSVGGNHAVEWVSASVASLPSRLLRVGTGRTGVPASTTTAAENNAQRLVTYPGYGPYALLQVVEEGEDAAADAQSSASVMRNEPAATRATAAVRSELERSTPSVAPSTSVTSRGGVVQSVSSVLSTAVQQSNQLYGNLRRSGAALGFEVDDEDDNEAADFAEAYGGLLSLAPRTQMTDDLASVGTAATTATTTTAAAQSPAENRAASEDDRASATSFRAYSTGGLTTWSGVAGASATQPPASYRAHRHVRWPLANGELTFTIHPRTRTAGDGADAVAITGPPIVLLILQVLDRPRVDEGGSSRVSGGTFNWLLANMPIAVERPLLAGLLAQLVASAIVYREVESAKSLTSQGTAGKPTTGRRQYCYYLHDDFSHLSSRKITVDATELLLQRTVSPWFVADDVVGMKNRHAEKVPHDDETSSSSCASGSSSSHHPHHECTRHRVEATSTGTAHVPSHTAAETAGSTPTRWLVEVCVVRCLKGADGPLSHQFLYEHVRDLIQSRRATSESTDSHSLLPRDVFKAALTSLVEKQFVERDEHAQSYRYLP